MHIHPPTSFGASIKGGGEWHIPDFIKTAGVPRSMYAHTSEAVDFDALKGKRIAILGGERVRPKNERISHAVRSLSLVTALRNFCSFVL